MAEIWNEDTTRFPLHRQRQGRPAQRADPDHRPAVAALVSPTGGKEGVEPTPEIKRIVEIIDKARTVGPRASRSSSPRSCSHLGRQRLRDRHRRPDADGPGRGRDQHQVPQRAGRRSATTGRCARPGNARTGAVLLCQVGPPLHPSAIAREPSLHRLEDAVPRVIRRVAALTPSARKTRHLPQAWMHDDHDPLHPPAADAAAAADGDLLLRHLRHHPGAAGRLPDSLCRHAGLVGLVDRRGADRGAARQYGLDQPIFVQYFLWLQRLLHGDFGLSLEYQRPNAELIGEQLGLTLALALFSFVLTWAIALPIGIYSATHPRSIGDYIFTSSATSASRRRISCWR